MKRLWILMLALLVFPGVVYAHNGMLHVMGTVTGITADNITVKTADGKTQSVQLLASTKYLKGNAVSSKQGVRVGQHVVIHATKKDDHLVAAEVKTGAMAGMSGMSGMKMPSPNM